MNVVHRAVFRDLPLQQIRMLNIKVAQKKSESHSR